MRLPPTNDAKVIAFIVDDLIDRVEAASKQRIDRLKVIVGETLICHPRQTVLHLVIVEARERGHFTIACQSQIISICL